MWYFLYHVESMFVNEMVADVYCSTVIYNLNSFPFDVQNFC